MSSRKISPLEVSSQRQLTLTGLFGAVREELPEELQRWVGAASSLGQPAGSGRFPVLDASDENLEVKDGVVRLFDQPFRVSGKLAADLLIHEPEAEVQILAFSDPRSARDVDSAELLTAPDGRVLSELRFQAQAGISGRMVSTPSGGLRLSANAAAGGGLVYRHLRPSPTTVTRKVALRRLLASSRPPALVPLELDELMPSEIHVLQTKLNFDFGLDVTFGGNTTLAKDLSQFQELTTVFQGTPAELRLDIDYSLRASFGYSLYQEMSIAVGRFNLVDDDWLRLRIQRLRRSELTLGAQLDLDVEYDLARNSVVALYNRVLALDPTRSFMSTLQEVQELRSIGWGRIRDKLAANVGDEIDQLLGGVDWRKWSDGPDRQRIDDLLHQLQKILEAYSELPDKIRGLWDTALGEADLGPESPILRALEKIQSIDPQQPAVVLGDLLGEEWKPAHALLEQLSGLSLDDLLAGRTGDVEEALVKAQHFASVALNFLEQVPAEVIRLLRNFAQRTGIEPAVGWLRTYATGVDPLVDALKTRANQQVQDLVSRLVGKKWNLIDSQDFEVLGNWLDRIESVLVAKDEWARKIRGYLNALRGELGFSFGLEMSRLTERSALVDLEFDPSKPVKLLVAKALVAGQARELLAELPEADSLEEAGYRIREAVFSSRRVRTGAMSFFFQLFGRHRRRGQETRRVDEETIRVTQHGGRLVRSGLYRGGVVRILRDDSDSTWVRTRELGAWLSVQAKGGGGNVARPYDQGVQERRLRVTFSRRDDNTQPEELGAIHAFLVDLGFPVQESELTPVAGSPITDLNLSLGLADGAVSAFFADMETAGWDTDCLNAGHRWYDDRLIRFHPQKEHRIQGLPGGQVLAAVLENAEFQSHWRPTADFLNHFRPALGRKRRSIRVSVAGRKVTVPIVLQPSADRRRIALPGLFELVASRERSLKALTRVQGLHSGLDSTRPHPKGLRQLAAGFSTTLGRTAFQGEAQPNLLPAQWPSTMFNLWLIFTRIRRVDASALAQVRGLATLRFKEKIEDDWQEPLRWQLQGGLPEGALSELFPIEHQSPDSVASKRSNLFHASLDCPEAANIKKKNRVFGALARQGRTPHDACHHGARESSGSLSP